MDRTDIVAIPKEGPLATPQSLSAHLLKPASPSNEPRHSLLDKISQELAELDREEEEFVRSINHRRVELRRLWNSALPVHKLPNELLVRLFADFRDAMTSYYLSSIYEGRPSSTGWPDLMVVCRRWRDVFVTTPAFWRTIDLGHQIDWTKLCLARSVPSSIDVFTRHEDRCPLGVIFPHARRFRRFFFQTAPGSQLERALSYLFGGGMPLLENLTFKVLQTPHMGDAVDANFTSHRFPSLQALTLQGTAAPRLGDVSFYIQLRQLSLNFCSYNLSFEGFLDALSACVQLEDLALINTLHFLPGGWAHDKAMPRRQPITLPCLRKFKAICHDALHTSRFLAHLYLQPSVVFEIAIDPFRGPLVGGEGNWEPPDIIIDATTIREMLPPNRLATLPLLTVATHVEITDMHSEYCIRCGYGYLVDPRTGSPDSALKVNTVYWDDPPDGLLTQGLHDLVECFNRAPLTGLKVHAFQLYATVDIWEAVFLAFPLLEELIFDGTEGASGIFLGLHAASSRTRDESSVACPKLNRVSAGRLCTAAAFEAMRECFQHRADRGARLQVLDLRRDVLDGGDLTMEQRSVFVTELRQVVCCVEDN